MYAGESRETIKETCENRLSADSGISYTAVYAPALYSSSVLVVHVVFNYLLRVKCMPDDEVKYIAFNQT